MKFKKLTAIFLTALIFITALSAGINAAALVMCETQYSYDKADMSWLKDLIIKEDMTSIGGLSKRNTYTPKAKYPYRETAASFKEEVAYYQALYTLDEDMANVIYLYMLELTKSFADSVNVTEYSDEFIKDYLESLGIVYPSGSENSEETKIVARALFALITNDEDFTVKRGTGLYEAFTDYFSDITGVNVSSIIKFDQDGNLTGLKEYVLAACRFMLYQAGYDVDKDTSEKEVYRLVAIMIPIAQAADSAVAELAFEGVAGLSHEVFRRNDFLFLLVSDGSVAVGLTVLQVAGVGSVAQVDSATAVLRSGGLGVDTLGFGRHHLGFFGSDGGRVFGRLRSDGLRLFNNSLGLFIPVQVGIEAVASAAQHEDGCHDEEDAHAGVGVRSRAGCFFAQGLVANRALELAARFHFHILLIVITIDVHTGSNFLCHSC